MTHNTTVQGNSTLNSLDFLEKSHNILDIIKQKPAVN